MAPPPGTLSYGLSPVPPAGGPASGRLVRAFGEDCSVIDDVQALPPFLTTVVSASDLWLFVASNGGLTAGRGSPATALFPYVTDDKLLDAPGVSGPVTALVATPAGGGRSFLWHPLRELDGLVYPRTRRLYKNVLGTRLVFEETNHQLGLTFRAAWRTSERFGFVRECELENGGPAPVEVRLLDGFLDLLPGDADERLQQGYSCLLDAYKQSERLPGSTLAVYTLAAQVVDRAEPREALHATAVWSHGLPGDELFLTQEALSAFQRGQPLPSVPLARGQRGAYLRAATLPLGPRAVHRWLLVADVARTQAGVAALALELRDPAALQAAVEADVAAGRARIEALVAGTDALQHTADRPASARHVANVLFNGLRGGVYAHGTGIPGRDFEAFLKGANRPVAARHRDFLAALPALEPREAFQARVAAVGDPDLTRLAAEYLPLTFSRRHGDPSRPWNRFDIKVKDARGEPLLDYQGNWRDIFQNWEALSRSVPGFVEQLIAKFVNASTADGHNPYRIGKDGIDWEVPEPGHPWATIGYWGDHQLVYLQRLLELSLRHHPARLPAALEQAHFVYADVPYRLVPYRELVADPRSTIRFDEAAHRRALARVAELGSDGRLLHGAAGLVRVTLLEKLLVPALAKVANLVPGGGVWMNTQRPEWNDANNALVGFGVSLVTLCQLERYLAALEGLVPHLGDRLVSLSAEVARWLEATLAALEGHRAELEAPAVDDAGRGRVMEALGEAAGAYRERLYAQGPGAPVPVAAARLRALCARAGAAVRRSIAQGRRADGLYHAYQVLVPRGAGQGFGLQPLEEMLEGQVAALSTPAVDDAAALQVLEALPASRLFRADQRSYLLYPDRRLPGFLEKNVVPAAVLARAPGLAALLERGESRVVLRDAAGQVRFAGGLHNAEALREVLAGLAAEGVPGVDGAVVAEALEAYEAVFNHRAFTGRSGTMFAYEGLGSIYWHMVGKLLLAVQERFVEAAERGAPAEVLEALARHHEAIRAGMGGGEKSPATWGAFPLDPYSHSPAHAGARQPGMTGQVKEEILIRLGELGVLVRGGRVAFRPRLLRAREFLTAPETFEPLALDGRRLCLPLPAGSLAFTLCQVPVVYRRGEPRRLVVHEGGGAVHTVDGDELDAERSAALFARSGRLERIEVWTQPGRP